MPNAAAIAAIQSRHRFERGQLHDAHRNQHDHLRMLQAQQREREREEARRRDATPPKRAGAHAPVHVRDDDADVRDRVKAHADLDAKQRRERDDMAARHTREIDAERTRPTSSAGPDRHSGPSGPGALGAVLGHLSAAQQAEYHALKQKFAGERQALNDRQDADRQRQGRYDHARTMARSDEAREAEHRKINEAEEAAIAAFRRKVEHEIEIKHQREAVR
jgi:hypothetical protein